MATLFSKIISGEISCYKIAENEYFFAFLDIAPQREGHTLIVPKIEVDQFFDLPDSFLDKLLLFAKSIARGIETAFDCDRCGMAVVGLEVPHAHLHLVPVNSAEDLNFTRKKEQATANELQLTQAKILLALRNNIVDK